LKVHNLARKKYEFLNGYGIVFEVIVLSSDASAFQALGAATMNALSAVWVLVLGMTKSTRLVERNRS